MSVNTPRRPAVAALLADGLRYWWLAAALFALVAAGSAWRAYGPGAPRTYVSAASFYVVVAPPPGATTSDDTATAQERAVAVARAIAQGDLFRDPTFDSTVAAQLTQAAPAAGHPSADDVAISLTATHAGDLVTLTARWPTPSAATLAAAAEQTVQQYAVAGQLPLGSGAVPVQVVIQPAAAASPATLDPDVEAA